MEQEKRVSLNADVMLRRALDLKADNVLIAEFMGIVYPKLDNVIVIDNVVIKEEELQYHKSWDWLMPVVIKVGGNGNLLAAMKNLRTHGVLRTIEDIHQAVVEFINQLKTK